MTTEHLFYGGGGALFGGVLGMAFGGPFGAMSGASAGCSLGLGICSSAITDKLKIKAVDDLTDLIGEISKKCSGKLMESIDYAIRTTTNSASFSIQSFTTQITYTINALCTTIIGGVVGGGLYLVISNDLSSRCSTFPLSCSVLGVCSTLLIGTITFSIIYNLYQVSSLIKKDHQSPTPESVHALTLEKGLNLIGECRNGICEMNKKKVILSPGFGTFDIGSVASNFLCGKCAKRILLNSTEIIANRCKFSYRGWDDLGTERKQDPMRVNEERVPNYSWRVLGVVTEE